MSGEAGRSVSARYTSGMGDHHSHSSALSATLAGVLDRFRQRGPQVALEDDLRLDGKTVVITGANRGLGRGIAGQLARRGARLILACRSEVDSIAESLRAETGHSEIEALPLDLVDFDSIAAFAGQLKARQARVDVLVLNAGLVPLSSRKTAAGHDLMFQVNHLGNVALVERLLADGIVPNDTLAGNGAEVPPRIVLVSSESHRTAAPLSFEDFGAYRPYGTSSVMAHYGTSKRLVTAYAWALGRHLTRADGSPDVSVHALCPGAVASDIAREAPRGLSLLLKPTMKLFFQAPDQAAIPVVWLCAATDIEGTTGCYLHMRVRKEPADEVLDEAIAQRVRDESLALIHSHLEG